MGESIVAVVLLVGDTGGAPSWVTKDTLFTAAGSTTAVIIVTTVLHGLFRKFPAKWFALAFSLTLTLSAISVMNQGWQWQNVLVAIVNGLITYSAAVGVNTVVTSPPATAAATGVVSGRSYRWWA